MPSGWVCAILFQRIGRGSVRGFSLATRKDSLDSHSSQSQLYLSMYIWMKIVLGRGKNKGGVLVKVQSGTETTSII